MLVCVFRAVSEWSEFKREVHVYFLFSVNYYVRSVVAVFKSLEIKDISNKRFFIISLDFLIFKCTFHLTIQIAHVNINTSGIEKR